MQRPEAERDVGAAGIFGGLVVARPAGRAFLAVFVTRIAGQDVVGIHQILDLRRGKIDYPVPAQRDILPVDIERPEIDRSAVAPETPLEAHFLRHARDRSETFAVEGPHALETERLRVDPVEIKILREHHRETGRLARVFQTQLLVLDVFAGQRVLDFGRRHLFAVFAEGADAVVFVIPVPVVACAEQREDAAVEIAPAGGEGDRRSLAPLRAVSRARARGEIRERHRFDVGRFRQIRGLHRVE